MADGLECYRFSHCLKSGTRSVLTNASLPFGEGRVEHHLDSAARVAYHLPDGVEGDDETAVDPKKEVRRQFSPTSVSVRSTM